MQIVNFKDHYSKRANSMMQELNKEKNKIKILERAEKDMLD